MLQPSQLADVAGRYAADIVELRAFLIKAGVHVQTSQAIASVASRVQHDRAFHRDLTVTLWVTTEGGDRQIGFAELLGVLAIASAGIHFASDAEEQDALALLQFLKEIRHSRETQARFRPDFNPAVPALHQNALLPDEPLTQVGKGNSGVGDEQPFNHRTVQRTLLWPRTLIGRPRRRSPLWIAGLCFLLLIALTAWFYRRSFEAHPDIQQAAIPASPESESTGEIPKAPVGSPGKRYSREPSPMQSADQHSAKVGAPMPVTTEQANTPSSTAASSPSDHTGRGPSSAVNAAPITTSPLVAKNNESPLVMSGTPATASSGPVLAPRTPSQPATTPPIPASILSKRLGTPTLPQYASKPGGEGRSDVPSRPRLLRRHNATGDDPSLVAELQPLGKSSATDSPSSTTESQVGSVRPTALGIMAANVIYSPVPYYPIAASAAHVTGEVKVQAEIDRDGTVTYARVVSGPPLLRDAALNAVQQWRYRPYLSRGKAVPFTTLAVMDFQLP